MSTAELHDSLGPAFAARLRELDDIDLTIALCVYSDDEPFDADVRYHVLEENWRRQLEAEKQAQAQTGVIGRAKSEGRSVVLRRADGIVPKAVHWLWEDRIPRGGLTLLAGREGIGKSTAALNIAADLTRGALPGEYAGEPQSVVIAATEDAWAETIVPRLIAANADLHRIAQLQVETGAGLSFPDDLTILSSGIDLMTEGVGLVILDPLTSRLGRLDSHKDAEVRQALEPLVAFAESKSVAVLGLMHFNKSTGHDAVSAVMGSRAFTAVARSVLIAMRMPDNDDAYVLGHGKSNLGRRMVGRGYSIEGVKVAEGDDGEVWTSRIVWTGDIDRSLDEIHENAGDVDLGATDEAAEWLTDFLTMADGAKASRLVKEAAGRLRVSDHALRRARKRLGVVVTSEGYPRETIWTLPASSRVDSRAVSLTTDTTDTTDTT